MAPRRRSNNPNKKPLPTPEIDGNEETRDKIEELLFQLQQEEKAAARAQQNPQTQPTQRQRSPRRSSPQRRITRTNLSLGNNKGNNCCNCCDDMLGMLSIINDSVSKVLNALRAESLLEKKKTDEVKKNQEERERREKENLLESSGRKLSRTFQQAFAPIKSAMEAVFKFILFTLAGRAIGKILKWFSDPANEKKVKSLTRFLKDWWPALLGAFVLFGTKFGSAIRSSIGAVVSTVLYLRKIGIPGMLAGLKSFGIKGLGFTAAAGGLFLAYNALTKDDNEKKQETNTPPNKGNAPASGGGAGTYSSGGLVRGINFFLPEERHVSEIGYAAGGHIDESSGIAITGAGPDTQLIAAQPGEVVMSKAAVDKFGADTFLRMNMMAGSSNRPKFAGNIQFAQQGGIVGGIMSGIKSVGSNMMKGFGKEIPNLGRPAKATNSFTPPNKLSKTSLAETSLIAAMDKAGITDKNERAMFLAQVRHETGNFKYDEEIASGKQYEGRKDLGNVNPGDGIRYKGRGYIMLTGREQYRTVGKKIGVDLENKPELAKNPDIAARTSIEYWKSRVNRNAARNGDVKTVTYNVNGGYNGLSERQKYFDYYVKKGIPQTQYNEQSSLPSNKLQLVSMAPTVRPPGPRAAGTVTITELPPINLAKGGKSGGDKASPDVPDFSAIPPAHLSDRYGDTGTLKTYGIETA